jgi:hypothetical protein
MADLAGAVLNQAMDPMSVGANCKSNLGVCAAGFILGSVMLLVIMLIWYFYFRKSERMVTIPQSVISSIYGPSQSDLAVLAGMSTQDPRFLKKEHLSTMAQVWK